MERGIQEHQRMVIFCSFKKRFFYFYNILTIRLTVACLYFEKGPKKLQDIDLNEIGNDSRDIENVRAEQLEVKEDEDENDQCSVICKKESSDDEDSLSSEESSDNEDSSSVEKSFVLNIQFNINRFTLNMNIHDMSFYDTN